MKLHILCIHIFSFNIFFHLIANLMYQFKADFSITTNQCIGGVRHIAPLLAVCQTTLRAQRHQIILLLLVPKHIVKSRLITLMNEHFVYLMLVRNSEEQ